ncbi:MAG: D-aminoacyl-tRNA deacylase, partial [Dysgonomonas sp.]
MRTLIQRVTHSSVTVNGTIISEISGGLTILLGIEESDNEEDIEWLCHKIANLRIFDDENGVMNRSVLDTSGEVLVISQFTLLASTKKGNRPSYIRAAKPDTATPLYRQFCEILESKINKPLKTGQFGAHMSV